MPEQADISDDAPAAQRLSAEVSESAGKAVLAPVLSGGPQPQFLRGVRALFSPPLAGSDSPLSGHRPARLRGEPSLCLSFGICPRGHGWALWKLPSGRPWGRAIPPDL